VSEKKFADKLVNIDVDYDQVVVVKVEEVEKSDQVDIRSLDSKALLMFFLKRFREVHGYQYKSEWVKELAIMRSFVKRYGPEAGLIVESLFDDYGGKWRGQPISVTVFSSGSKWIQDKVYFYVKEKAEKQKKREASQKGDTLQIDDFLTKFGP